MPIWSASGKQAASTIWNEQHAGAYVSEMNWASTWPYSRRSVPMTETWRSSEVWVGRYAAKNEWKALVNTSAFPGTRSCFDYA